MSTLLVVKYILFGSVMLFNFIGYNFTHIQTYTDTCNETVTLSDIGGAGHLFYNHNISMKRQFCEIVIKAEPGFRIGYVFIESSAYRTIYRRDDMVYYICTSVAYYEGDVQIKYNCLSVNNSSTKQVETTQENTLTLKIDGDDSKDFTFELIFFSFHEGKCRSNESLCRLEQNSHSHIYACLGQSLRHENVPIFCDADYQDFKRDYTNKNNGLIAGIVLTCVIFVPAIVSCTCFVYRKYCKQPEPDVEDIPTRARRIFAAIMEEAHDNAGFDTEPIDPSKYDPPPEYDSLEHLNVVTIDGSVSKSNENINEVSKECPPDYHDVMNNSNDYFVSCHI